MSQDKPQNIVPHPVLTDYYESSKVRRSKVDGMFNSSAEHYDWICNVMSFGSGRWYRKDALIRAAGVSKGMNVLDVGAGTGVISLIAQDLVGSEGLVVALDPSKGMLSEAKNLGVRHMSMGLGETLPFPDNSFDVLTMGYALRHVASLNDAFMEYLRVLKPGGKILLLEITRPENKLFKFILKAYMKGVIPILTRLFRRSADAQELMRYYWDTIEHCVAPETIMKALQDQGGVDVNRHVVMGIFSEYTAVKHNQ